MMACYGGPPTKCGSYGSCDDNPDASSDATGPDGGVN
jgi:hypothetical protein